MPTAFHLTNHLPSHEDDADGAGDVKFPPGQTSRVGLGPRRRVRLLTEPLRLPQAVHAGGIFTQL